MVFSSGQQRGWIRLHLRPFHHRHSGFHFVTKGKCDQADMGGVRARKQIRGPRETRGGKEGEETFINQLLGGNNKEPACQCRRHKRCGFDPWVGKIPWRRAWQPTPVFLPAEFYEQRSLAGYGPWGCKESDMTEHTHTLHHYPQLTGEKLRHRQMT